MTFYFFVEDYIYSVALCDTSLHMMEYDLASSSELFGEELLPASWNC